MTAGLYVHLPFCRQKCRYCDFASFAGLEGRVDEYLRALGQEAAQSAITRFDTLYVGGGTPSVLSAEQLERLAGLLAERFGPISAFKEATCEANPESLTPDKIRILRQAGFSRLSLGLQSFDDEELKKLGRVHDVNTFLQTYQNARAGGFDNMNVDLIAGQPGQPLDGFLRGLEKLVALRPEHISVYGLQIEEGTPFFESGLVCDQPLMRRMLEETHERLERAGFAHYEISNYALPGKEAAHNTNYWQNGPYVGLGSAAASYVGGVRRHNTADVNQYIARLQAGQSPVEFEEKLEGKAREGETLLLGLRRLAGVQLTPAQNELFGAEIDRHVQTGLLLRENDTIKLSAEGLYLANEVFESFVEPFE